MNEEKRSYKNKFQFSVFSFQFLRKSAFICVHLWLISLCFFIFPIENRAQIRPVYDLGAIGLGQLLKRLNTTKSVMMIGAHPDDEDSALLAFLARGENARTAYLSLTRGDGGQNVIGAELFESLGVIRTEELLQARRLDGAEQFFTRAFDYGFSKTLTEAKEKWDEKIILCDAVRAIRQYRPLVVISRFSGTPADGHGQHQYAGYISPLAVKAAADSSQCADAGAVWQVLKFYVEQGFRSNETATLRINTGEYDFLLGRSYAEIAAEGRSLHRTQEQGNLELKGDRFSGLNLIESKAAKVENETSIFDGIDASLANAPKIFTKDEKAVSDATKDLFKKLQQSAELAIKEFDPNNPQKIIPVLTENQKIFGQISLGSLALSETEERRKRSREASKNESDLRILSFIKLYQCTEAIKLAAGVQIDALSSKEIVAPNEDFLASVKVFYPANSNIKIKTIKLNAPENWQIGDAVEPKNDSPYASFTRETAKDAKFFSIKVSANQSLTEPYFLEKPRVGALYQMNAGANPTLPFQESLVTAEITAVINGTEIVFTQPIEYRYADGVRGEIRRDLNVVPKISLRLDQNLLIVPRSNRAQTRKITLSVTSSESKALTGEAKLNAPQNWRVSPASVNFDLKNKGATASVTFDVVIPANAENGNFDISAQAVVGGETFTQTQTEIAYPHIQTHRFYTDARAKVEVLDLKVAPVKVGYIMGSGDAVPEAIRQMNLPVDFLSEADLTSGDLSKYDVIVLGIRVFDVRADFAANNQRITDYVKNGGTLIVQYQRSNQNLFPFPATIGARVTDENAKVTILDAANTVFNSPNKITEKDFENWVQERNLYAFSEFDANYKPLLEAHDVNEPENKGGLVVANIGKGKYVYCSYAFFRQLPAGVPGAYRLFANLLSLK